MKSAALRSIYTTSVVLTKQQLAVRKQLLEALDQRSDITSEQAMQIAEALSWFSDALTCGYRYTINIAH